MAPTASHTTYYALRLVVCIYATLVESQIKYHCFLDVRVNTVGLPGAKKGNYGRFRANDPASARADTGSRIQC